MSIKPPVPTPIDYPPDLASYNAAYNAAVRASGYGAETKFHLPCPRCTAGDWLVYNIVSTQEAMIGGATCKKCGFGMKGIPSEKPNASIANLSPETVKANNDAAREAARVAAAQSGTARDVVDQEMNRQISTGAFEIQDTFLTINGKTFEFVQTAGPEPPPYLPPMRRVEDIDQKS